MNYVCCHCRLNEPDHWYLGIGALCWQCVLDWWAHPHVIPAGFIEGPVP